MYDIMLIILIRMVILSIGGIFAISGGIVGLRWIYDKPKGSDILTFIFILSLGVLTLGTILILIGVGNYLMYSGYSWAYALTVSAGLAGILGVAFFWYGMRSIEKSMVV